MNARNVFGLVLCALLLALATGSGWARGPQPSGPPEVSGANASPGANAPWFKDEVDTPHDTGQHTSVAIHPSGGRTYVSYYDAGSQALRLTFAWGGCGRSYPVWWFKTIDDGADFGKYSSVAVNPVSTEEAGIAYYDTTNGHLKYAHIWRSGGTTWHLSHTIDKGIFPISSAGLYTSLKFFPNGRPVIAYYFDNPSGVDALKVAYRLGSGGNCGYGDEEGKWQCDTIDTGEGIGQHASLALDGDGFMHIAYYDRGIGDLRYATNRSGINCGPFGNTWTCYPVSVAYDVGQYASLYVDNGNHFHIAYYDATYDKLKYAVDVDYAGNCGLGGAQCDEIDSMQDDYHPLGVSMAQDAAGRPIIAYQSEYGDLNVARPVAAVGLPTGGGNCGPGDLLFTWFCETIDPRGKRVPYRNADYASIGLCPSGLAAIAYYRLYTDHSDGNLVVAYQKIQVFLPLVMRTQ